MNDKETGIRLKNLVRNFQIKDFFELHEMYDSSPEVDKYFFHPIFLGKRNLLSIKGLIIQFAILTSTCSLGRRLLTHIMPASIFLLKIAENESGELMGFSFIKVMKFSKTTRTFDGELGIFVRNEYQRKHVGFELMNNLLDTAKHFSFREIFLTVVSSNFRAINLYKKFGFKVTRIMPYGDSWRGKKFDCVEMVLNTT